MNMAMSTMRSYSFLLLALIFFMGGGVLNKNNPKTLLVINKQDSAVNFNNSFLKIFSIGQTRLISDALWILTLLESDLEHYKQNDLNSWMYQRFNSITSLDPRFLTAYQFGGKYLSIVKDDLGGAEVILTKGLKVYPGDYNLIFDLAFLYGFEMNEYSKAAYYYEKLLLFPKAPKYIASLIPKMQYSSGISLQDIFPVVLEAYKNEPKDSFLKLRLEQDLYAIKAQIDLECLNLKKLDCSNRDLMGNLYVVSNGIYSSLKEFKAYRLNKR